MTAVGKCNANEKAQLSSSNLRQISPQMVCHFPCLHEEMTGQLRISDLFVKYQEEDLYEHHNCEIRYG